MARQHEARQNNHRLITGRYMARKGQFKSHDPRSGKGGKRLGAGPPKKSELEAQAARLSVWQQEIEKREAKLAKRYVDRAFKDDRVLLDLRRTRLSDAKQEIDINQRHAVIFETIDPNAERRRKRLELSDD